MTWLVSIESPFVSSFLSLALLMVWLFRSGLNVGIAGGGIAGLHTALLLQHEAHHVRIFEGTERIGGRVHTPLFYYTAEDNQYYEGAVQCAYLTRISTRLSSTLFNISTSERQQTRRLISSTTYILTAAGDG
ncbi:hypothetical protein F4809DRAFT_125559 [Biscogniauxia mediterranea]|nr:hypothetical protein F4809DRAFT_125559 [Biscogniauxia mediterranea]